MIRIGFTGTRDGMTDEQMASVRELIKRITIHEGFEAHHGDCIGADAEFHEMVRSEFMPRAIVIHPPNVDALRAFCESKHSLTPKNYIARNREIVNACEFVMAAPKETDEQRRGGTWSTVRYARQFAQHKAIAVALPHGPVKFEGKPWVRL